MARVLSDKRLVRFLNRSLLLLLRDAVSLPLRDAVSLPFSTVRCGPGRRHRRARNPATARATPRPDTGRSALAPSGRGRRTWDRTTGRSTRSREHAPRPTSSSMAMAWLLPPGIRGQKCQRSSEHVTFGRSHRLVSRRTVLSPETFTLSMALRIWMDGETL